MVRGVQGNKVAVTIIVTPVTNLRKKGDYSVGAVDFHNDRTVKRFRVEERVNAIVNRLKCVAFFSPLLCFIFDCR